jgi:hypothetical protein
MHAGSFGEESYCRSRDEMLGLKLLLTEFITAKASYLFASR